VSKYLIVRYELLLNEFSKQLAKDSRDNQETLEVLASVRQLNQSINLKKKEAEECARLCEIQDSFPAMEVLIRDISLRTGNTLRIT
jgi:hypothetical protein